MSYINFANAQQDFLSDGVKLYFADKTVSKIAVMTEVTFKSFDRDAVEFPAVPLGITKEAARNLMDALWNCGVRPSNGAQTVGELSAVKSHLEDMRTLYFKTAKTVKP